MTIVFYLTVLAAPFILYVFVVRPRLRARFVDLYAEIDGFWLRQWERIKAMRSLAIALLGSIAYALPELLRHLQLIDFSFLPSPWGGYVAIAVSIALTLARAFATPPIGEAPSGER